MTIIRLIDNGRVGVEFKLSYCESRVAVTEAWGKFSGWKLALEDR
jgi:hypothetical protein